MDEKSALLITTRKNAKWLSSKLKENGCTYIRLIRGRHRSLKLLNEQIRNYEKERYFVFDIQAIAEQSDELAEILAELQRKVGKKTVILYAPDISAVNPLSMMLNEYRICNVCRHSTDPVEQAKKETEDFHNYFQNGAAALRKVKVTKHQAVSPRRPYQRRLKFNGIYDGCCAAIIFFGDNQKRTGKTYAALATAFFFRFCNARTLFLFQSSEELENFRTYYCPTASKESDLCGYKGFWYRDDTEYTENLFMSACDRYSPVPASGIEREINFIVTDCEIKKAAEIIPSEMIQTPVLVTSCGFRDDGGAKKLLQKLGGSGIHAITFGDERRKSDFEHDFPEWSHYLIPFLPEITRIPAYFSENILDGFVKAFNPEIWKFYVVPPDENQPEKELTEETLVYKNLTED